MTRCGKKYRLRNIDDSLQHCHLRVIMDRDIKDTSEVGGKGAFVHTCLRSESKLANLPGSTIRNGDSSLRLSLIADSAASSYCWPIILRRRYFARTVEQRRASC